MVFKKDIDSKWTRQIDLAIRDVEDIKEQINILNHNDSAIEDSLYEALSDLQKKVNESITKIIESLNQLIDKEDKDVSYIHEEIKKLYTLVELKEKEYKSLNVKITDRFEDFLKTFNSIDGYYKNDGGVLKGMKLPEERIFSEKYRVETVTETIIEQPIIKEVEKQETPILTKSSLEHFYDYGIKLSEEIMAPKFIDGFERLQVNKEPEVFYKNNKKIILFKFIKTLLLVFLEDGTTEITNTIKGSTIFKGDIIKDIKDQLSIEISPMEITTIQPQGQGIYIATLNNGVLFYNIINKTISTEFAEDGVIHIEKQGDKTLLISETVSVYNEDNLRTYNSKIFVNKNIKPLKVEKLSNGRIVVLAGGEKKGLADLIYSFDFVNGELIQKYIYTDPFDQRDTYFYNIVSDNNTVSIIGNRDGNYVSYVYDINKLDETYRIRVLEKETGLKGIAYNNSNDNFILVFDDKLIHNNKVIYGLDYSEDRNVIYKDMYAYLIYDHIVERIDMSEDIGNAFRFPVNMSGDGSEVKIIIKLDSKELPIIRVEGKVLTTYRLLDYLYVVGAVPGDVIEINMNGSTIDDISVYSEYSLLME